MWSSICKQWSQPFLGDALAWVISPLWAQTARVVLLGSGGTGGVGSGCGSKGRWVSGAHQESSSEAVCSGFPAGTTLTLFYGVSEIPSAVRGCSFMYLCFCVYMNSCAFPVDGECLTNVPRSLLWVFSGSCIQLPGWGRRAGHNVIHSCKRFLVSLSFALI